MEEDLFIAKTLRPSYVYKHVRNHWRLFIDSSSKRSLKCVHFHIGTKYGSIPIGYSIDMKEKYEEIKKYFN